VDVDNSDISILMVELKPAALPVVLMRNKTPSPFQSSVYNDPRQSDHPAGQKGDSA
jgi:hypothetical protein